MIDVLIVGAGPTGLVLGLWLQRQAIRVRIIDKAAGPGTASRALVVHARTLEYYAMLGLADEAIDAGRKFDALNMWVSGRHAARATIGDIGEGLSPFPFALILPQDEHERMLLDRLQTLGGTVEYHTELVGFHQERAGVTARILLNGKEGAVGLMPPVGGVLSDDQIAAVLTYIRRQWGNTGSPVDPETTKNIRALSAGRSRPWTEEELARIADGAVR